MCIVHDSEEDSLIIASRSLVGSFLGILFTGLVIGLEGFSASGIFYNLSGWFILPCCFIFFQFTKIGG